MIKKEQADNPKLNRLAGKMRYSLEIIGLFKGTG